MLVGDEDEAWLMQDDHLIIESEVTLVATLHTNSLLFLTERTLSTT